MGKRPEKKDDLQDVLSQMPIAQAILTNNVNAMAAILQANLPTKGAIVVVDSIEKSVGEKFTGGSSTPIYRVFARVTRPSEQPKRRQFVVKLVLMPETDSYTLVRCESYAVERRFYETTAKRVREAPLPIPKLIASDLNGSKPWPAFCILMNDVSIQYPQHPDFLTKHQAACALN